MARTDRRKPAAKPAAGRLVTALALLIVAVEVAVLPGAASPYRLPKMALALAGLAVLGAAAAIASRGRITLRRGGLSAAVAVLPVLSAASAAWATSPRTALLAAAASAVWAAAAIALSTLELPELERLGRAAGWGAALSALAVALQLLGSPVVTANPAGAASRFQLTGLTGNPADLAMAALLPLPLILSPLLGGGSRRRGWLLPGVLVAAALATRTLTAVAAVCLLAGAVVLLTRSRAVRRAVVGSLLLAAVVVPFTELGGRVARAAGRLAAGDWYQLLSARADGWSAAVQMIGDHPVLGVGAGHFDRAYYPSRVAWLDARGGVGGRGELATHFEHAHCEPLQVVAELGLPGAAWLAALVCLFAWRGRWRRDPRLVLLAAVALPFVLLHYPLRLAVGILPLVVAAAAVLREEPEWRPRAPRGAGATAAVLAAAALVAWQAGAVVTDRWRGEAEGRLVAAGAAPPATRVPVLLALESEAEARASGVSAASGDLWRLIGRSRLLRDDPAGAAAAFRTAKTVWPHEEAEFGLGLALAALGRRTEAIAHLGRVCRTNPSLLELIPDPGLRAPVAELVAAARDRRTS